MHALFWRLWPLFLRLRLSRGTIIAANIGQAMVNLKLWLIKSSSLHRQLSYPFGRSIMVIMLLIDHGNDRCGHLFYHHWSFRWSWRPRSSMKCTKFYHKICWSLNINNNQETTVNSWIVIAEFLEPRKTNWFTKYSCCSNYNVPETTIGRLSWIVNLECRS